MKPRSLMMPISILTLVLCSGAAASAAMGRAQPPAAASESAVTLKPSFKVGDTIRYRIVIDRTDANIVPAAMMSPPAPAAPAKPDAPSEPAPAGDAPKSNPANTDHTPDPSKPPAEAAKPGTAEAPPPANGETTITASSRASVDSIQALSVKEVGDAGIKFELTFESIKADIKMPERAAAYDSSKPEDDKDRDNVALQTFKPIVGLVLHLTADKDGNITDVKGNEQHLNASSPAMSGFLQGLTGSDNVRINWNMLLHAKRGGGTFKVGDTWINEDAFPVKQLGARFEITRNSTLRGVSGGVASIDSTGGMKLVPTEADRKPPFELKNGNLLQTATWTVEDGMTKKSEFQRTFQLDGSAQGFPLKRQSEIKLTAERIK